MRRRVHEASPGQQEIARRRIFQRLSLYDHVWPRQVWSHQQGELLWQIIPICPLKDDRSISSSGTRIQRLASTKRSTSRVHRQPKSTKRPLCILSLFTRTMILRSRLMVNQARRATFSTILLRRSILSEKLMIQRTRSQRPGSMRQEFLIQRLPSLKIGMKMLHSKSWTKRPPNLKIGSKTNRPWSPTQRPKSQKTGTTKKMATGFPRWYPMPNVTKSLAAANGKPLPKRIQTTRVSGLQTTLTTQNTRASGSQGRSPTPTSSRIKHPLNLSPWAL